MVVIQIQSQFRNQFWSLIPKMISDFIFFNQKYNFGYPKMPKNAIFGTQKMPLLMKKI